jgi:hypothetical protein
MARVLSVAPHIRLGNLVFTKPKIACERDRIFDAKESASFDQTMLVNGTNSGFGGGGDESASSFGWLEIRGRNPVAMKAPDGNQDFKSREI